MSLTPDYFDRMYAAADDPWGFTTRWYEQRKYALTLAALPQRRFGTALEVGCSVGVLTAALASRCDRLVALDASAAALASARTRVPAEVELVQAAVPGGWPAGTYDLVLLSEVGYYLDPPDLERLLDRVRARPGAGRRRRGLPLAAPGRGLPADRRRGARGARPLAAAEPGRGGGLPARRARPRTRG